MDSYQSITIDQVVNIMKYLTLILMLSACYAKRDYNVQPPISQEECMDLFRNIHIIQELRGEASGHMRDYSNALRAGKISKKKHAKKRAAWLEEEENLRTEVTKLYDVGYEYKCF